MYLLKYDFVNVSLMHDYSSSLFFVPDLFQPKEDSVEASSVLKSIIGQGKTALFLFSKTTTRVTPWLFVGTLLHILRNGKSSANMIYSKYHKMYFCVFDNSKIYY